MKKVGWFYRYRTYSIKCCHSNSCLGNRLRLVLAFRKNIWIMCIKKKDKVINN